MAPAVALGLRTGAACLSITVGVTLLTTILVGVTIMSNHWEVIRFSRPVVEKLLTKTFDGLRTESLFDGRALVVINGTSDFFDGDNATGLSINETADFFLDNVEEVLIQMHGGLWTVCLDLSGE